jgi:perosamine synthetase
VSTASESRLAIDGGQPLLPAGPPGWPPADEAVREALLAAYAAGNWGKYHGPASEQLADKLRQLVGQPHVLLCSSGTIAVELALRGLRIGSGDEVILAAYDFPGNFRAIEAVGARPVLVDLERDTWRLDEDQLAAAIGSETKAILVSHLHGSLADMPHLCEIATRRGLVVVEDACQVPGAIVAGRPAGAWGDCGVFSFGGSKLLTAGRGGAIVTPRADCLQRIKVFVERGNDAFPLSELQAAVLVPQFENLAAENEKRLAAATLLLGALGEVAGLAPLRLPDSTDAKPPCSNADNPAANLTALYKLPWMLAGNVDACDSPQFELRRRAFIAAIQAEGVAMYAGFRGFVRRKGNRCRTVGTLPNAQRAAAGTLLLHHPVLRESAEVVTLVAAAIRKVAGAILTPRSS